MLFLDAQLRDSVRRRRGAAIHNWGKRSSLRWKTGLVRTLQNS